MASKKTGRFDGLSEEEVKKKDSLPDYLEANLDIVFIGINPSLMAAHKGRYYAGPGNHFYKLLHASELVPKFVSFEEDHQLLQYKIGLTNIVERASRSSADLTKIEIAKGCQMVAEKIKSFKPKIAVFNGKCIYQVFAESLGVKKFDFGIQSQKIGDTVVWVVPSSSARCSNFPRMEDKLHFYQAIKKHLQFLKGEIADVDLKDYYIGGKRTQAVSVPKRVPKDARSLIEEARDNCPQFVVAEIHDGSNTNNNKNIPKVCFSDEGSEEDEESPFDQHKRKSIEQSRGIFDFPVSPWSLSPKRTKTDDSEEGRDCRVGTAAGLIDLINEKYEEQKKVWEQTSSIQKDLEKFRFKKQS